MDELLRALTIDIQWCRVRIPVRPTDSVDKVALFRNPASGETRCARISVSVRASDNMPKGALLRQVCVKYGRAPHENKPSGVLFDCSLALDGPKDQPGRIKAEIEVESIPC
jgi:hypothetical protein